MGIRRRDVSRGRGSGRRPSYAGKSTTTGALDSAFGGDGKISHAKSRPWDSSVADSVMAADGSIYTLGSYGVYGDYETYVFKTARPTLPSARPGAWRST